MRKRVKYHQLGSKITLSCEFWYHWCQKIREVCFYGIIFHIFIRYIIQISYIFSPFSFISFEESQTFLIVIAFPIIEITLFFFSDIITKFSCHRSKNRFSSMFELKFLWNQMQTINTISKSGNEKKKETKMINSYYCIQLFYTRIMRHLKLNQYRITLLKFFFSSI